MDRIIEILIQLQENSGKRLEEILKENYNNQLLKDILYFIYNPYIVTGLSTKKMNKLVKIQTKFPPAHTIKDVFNYLLKHNTGTYIDVAYVCEYINSFPFKKQEIISQIFTKELKLGITSKTINKVWNNLIPEFNVMLAQKYWDKIEELEKEKPEIIITQKLDGIRVLMEVNQKQVKFYSRQGKIIEGLNDIKNDGIYLKEGYYDGELLANKSNISSKDLYRETVSIVNSKEKNKKNIIFNVFDYCNINNFREGIDKTPCIDRKKIIYEELRKIESDWINPIPILYLGKYEKEIVQKELDKQIELENEGVMINIANAPYETKRTKNILKVKKMQSADLKIIGFEEGTGKNRNTLGAIIVDYKGNKVKVGSGFSDIDRDYIWNNQKELVDKIVEVQYFEETTNKKDNNISLRFPVYLRLRSDKNEISYY